MEVRRVRIAITGGVLLAGLAAAAAPAAAQATGSIRGRVVHAATARPLVGAQVYVPGESRGTLTNAGGAYLLLNVPVGTHTVRVELIGYDAVEQSVTVSAGQVAALDFEMSENVIDLDEIVVTGTVGGTQKRAIGNVVTQVRAAEAVDKALIPNVQGLINGRAPGVVIMPGTGIVGSGSRVRIRGASSLSLSNNPLIYVDGVRVDNAQGTGPAVQAFGSSVISRLNDFNPGDIESIEIIKGPAAATLYGTEAASGVIQIITKRGHIGRPRFNATIRQGANWFSNPEERVWTNWWRNPDTGEAESLNLVVAENGRGTPIFSTGRLQSYGINVSGGSEGARYYIGLDYDDKEGVEPTNYLDRLSARTNVSVFPHENVDITGSLGYVTGRTYLSCEAGCGGVTWGSFFSTPEHLNENLDLTSNPPRRGYRSQTSDVYWASTDYQDLGRFTGSLQVNYRPFSWLSQRLTLGLDQVTEDNVSFTENSETVREFSPGFLGGKSVNRRDVTYNTVDYSATASRGINESLTSNTTFGAQYYRRFRKFVSASGEQFVLPGLRVINATSPDERNAGETYLEDISMGVFLQEQVGWQDRLFLTAALRADDHSAFGQNFDLVYYPKAHAAWVVSEEPFFDLSFVNTLRLRAAYGQSGLQPNTFAALRTYAATTGPDDEPTVTPSEAGNPELGPMRASELEFGFDAGLLDDRLGLELTYYNTNIRDDILIREAPPSQGFPGSQFVNLGEHVKSGLELLVRGLAYQSRNVSAELTLSVATNNSDVKDLGDNDVLVDNSSFGVEHRKGYPIGSWFNYKLVDAQLDENGDFIRSSLMCATPAGGAEACYQPDPETGDTVFAAERVYLGRTLPKYEGAVSATITLLGNLRLYGLVDFKTGHKKWDHNLRVRCALFDICRENVFPLEYDPVTIAAYQNGALFGATYINDVSFAKLREVSLSYTLPASWTVPLGFDRATINVAGRNLHTWTEWTGMEPEAMYLSGGRAGFSSVEQNSMPQLMQFVTTLNLSF